MYKDENNQYDQPPMAAPTQVVVQQPMNQFVVAHAEPEFSWCHLVTSVISFFCCTIFGMIAIVMSLLSYVDHSVKSFERARSKKNCALGFGIAGIVIGVIMIIIVIAIVASGAALAVAATNSVQN